VDVATLRTKHHERGFGMSKRILIVLSERGYWGYHTDAS
jgi:hypothetical protein